MVTRAIECIGYPEFERLRIEKLVHLLTSLEIEVHVMEWRSRWTLFLWSVLRSLPGQEHMSSHYWKRIVPMAIQPGLFSLELKPSDLETMRSFEEAGDWERLEVWIGMMWILELPGDGVHAGEVERATRTLFHNRPNALQVVEGWVLGASEDEDSLYARHEDTFRAVCDQTREEIMREQPSRMSELG